VEKYVDSLLCLFGRYANTNLSLSVSGESVYRSRAAGSDVSHPFAPLQYLRVRNIPIQITHCGHLPHADNLKSAVSAASPSSSSSAPSANANANANGAFLPDPESDVRVKQNVSDPLQYGCLHWLREVDPSHHPTFILSFTSGACINLVHCWLVYTVYTRGLW